MKAWTKWQNWAVLVLGMLLVVAPWISGTALTHAWVAWTAGMVGVTFVASSCWAFAQPRISATEWGYCAWLQIILGAWLVIAPWLLGFAVVGKAAWTDWVIGIFVVVVSAWQLLEARKKRTKERLFKEIYSILSKFDV